MGSGHTRIESAVIDMEYQPLNLTLEDGRRALGVHVLEKGHRLRQKYGNFIDMDVLALILADEEFVRYPTRLEFDRDRVDAGLFGVVEKIGKDAAEGYVIYIHEYFRCRTGDVPALVLYLLVAVNYGDFASGNEAEEFASAALGMDKEYFYSYICRLVDEISGKEDEQCLEE